MYPLLAIDLDGTLLDGKKRISQPSIDAIKDYYRLGGKVIVVTGRSPVSASKKINEIETRAGVKIDYFVSFCGAYVYDNVNKKVLSETLMSLDKVTYLHGLARSRGYTLWQYFKSFVDDGRFVSTRSLITRGFVFSGKMRIVLSNKPPLEPAHKVNFIAYTPWGISSLIRFFKKNAADDFEYFRTARWTVELTNKGVTKAAGVALISKLTGISLKKTAAIGDSMNDLALLEEVGCPLAPSNAMEEVKKAAKKIVADKNHSAVAEAIRLIIDGAV